MSQIITELLEKRNLLEKVVDELEVENREVELAVFDIITHSLSSYHKKLHDGLDDFFELLKENSPDNEENKVTGDYKLRSALIDWKKKYGHAPAYIFVINYDETKNNHLEHIYSPSYHRQCVGKDVSDNEIITELEELSYEDNAILIDNNGLVIATETQLINVDPSKIIDELPEHEDLHLKLGFRQKVHSRHSSSIAASYQMKGTVVYTLSETGMVRRFNKGGITFSTVKEEQEIIDNST